MEKTVEHLETEVTGLLGLLEELASNLPPGPFSPDPDLLGTGEWLRGQEEHLLGLSPRVPGSSITLVEPENMGGGRVRCCAVPG